MPVYRRDHKRLNRGNRAQYSIDTIRTDFLVLPARLVRESRRNVVKLPHDYHYQREFIEASRRLDRLRLPGKFRICK